MRNSFLVIKIPRVSKMECAFVVCLGARRKLVKLPDPSLEALRSTVLGQCTELLPKEEGVSLVFQLKNTDWDMFIDIEDDTPIPNKSVVNVVFVRATPSTVQEENKVRF